jgi:hypothetical protein
MLNIVRRWPPDDTVFSEAGAIPALSRNCDASSRRLSQVA